MKNYIIVEVFNREDGSFDESLIAESIKKVVDFKKPNSPKEIKHGFPIGEIKVKECYGDTYTFNTEKYKIKIRNPETREIVEEF